MSFVTTITPEQIERLKKDLEEKGFLFSTPPHTLFQAKNKKISITVYLSGKLMVQGKERKEFIESYLEPTILGTFTSGYEHLYLDTKARIGVDESGKGDFFGPLCIAGVFAEGEAIQELQKIGVKDSKKLSDTTIEKIAQKIKKDYLHHIVRIGPEKYNELYKNFKNLNHLLGWGHATVIDYLLEKKACDTIIIDQFAAEEVVEKALKQKKRKAVLTQRPRAEEDVVVAAASILARAAFIEGLRKLEALFGIKMPKGASAAVVAQGKKIVETHGKEILAKVGKMHFKTSVEILGC